MAKWYYYNASNERIGPVRGRDLKQLVREGTVTQETKVEDSEGRIAQAKNVTGLTFPSVIPLPSNSAENLDEQDFERLREDFERQRELESAIQKIVPPTAPPAPPPPAPPAGANPFTAALPVSENPFIVSVPAEPNPFIAAPPSRKQTKQQQAKPPSVPVPVVNEHKGSLWITLVGILAILVVGGIGWAAIVAFSPQPVNENNAQSSPVMGREPPTWFPTIPPAPQTNNDVPPVLSPAEQAEVDKYIAEHGRAALAHYMYDIHKKDEDEKRVLKYCKYFISAGVDVNARDSGGDCPLIRAVQRKNIEIVQFLVSKGADVNARSTVGLPIEQAVYGGNVEVVKFLVSKGADVNVREAANGFSSSGAASETLLDVAKRLNHKEIIEYLSGLK